MPIEKKNQPKLRANLVNTMGVLVESDLGIILININIQFSSLNKTQLTNTNSNRNGGYFLGIGAEEDWYVSQHFL